MPDHPVQQAVLSLIKDGTNILRVTFGTRQVEVGETVPKGGQLFVGGLSAGPSTLNQKSSSVADSQSS